MIADTLIKRAVRARVALARVRSGDGWSVARSSRTKRAAEVFSLGGPGSVSVSVTTDRRMTRPTVRLYRMNVSMV
jgi:hypothetical protein